MNYFYILKKILKTIVYSLKFYINPIKNEPLLVSLPRSGTHLTTGLINICYSMKMGYPGNLGITDDGYSAYAKLQMPFDERSIYYQYKFPHLWHSHMPYTKIVPIRKKFCKTVVLVREPISGITSYMVHCLNDFKIDKFFNKEISYEDFLELDKRFNFVSHYSEFLDSWRKKKKENKIKDQIVIIDLEFLKNNTFKYLKFINQFFNFGFTETHMKRAVEQLDIKRVSSMSTEKSIRISKNKIYLSKQVEDLINQNCKKKYNEIHKILDNEVINK